ncbi:hypothetical protein WJX72_008190 [[Myrmecia] bisecta]|uniref:glutaminase n=1 Tax=[Myrmecia] bisecta TaxID=41462 RepID=A0AAW1QST0_9CHLO
MAEVPTVRVGVLALQGSFKEHVSSLSKLDNVVAIEVRTKEELDSVDGLIIPGGESTTMALVAQRWGLLPELRSFSAKRAPIWGTCAGLIFLADQASGQKEGGQELIGGLECAVQRNFFGAQINSFETQLPAPPCLLQYGADRDTFRAMFIRAPAVMSSGPQVEVLAEYKLTAEEAQAQGRSRVTVAVRSDHLLATAFHPELTEDLRWHQLFVDMVRQRKQADQKAGEQSRVDVTATSRPPLTKDLPIYTR